MNLFENLQTLNEANNINKVSNKNQKRTLKEIIDILTMTYEHQLIPKQCNELIEDIYYKAIEIKNLFNVNYESKSTDELKDVIWLAYMKTSLDEYIEEFVESHGVSSDSETIFDGLSDEAVKELYNSLRKKIISQYGPDYEELNNEVFDSFDLMHENVNVKFEAPGDFSKKVNVAKDTLSHYTVQQVRFVQDAYEEVLADIGDASNDSRGNNSTSIKNKYISKAIEDEVMTEEEFNTIYKAIEIINVFYSQANK